MTEKIDLWYVNVINSDFRKVSVDDVPLDRGKGVYFVDSENRFYHLNVNLFRDLDQAKRAAKEEAARRIRILNDFVQVVDDF